MSAPGDRAEGPAPAAAHAGGEQVDAPVTFDRHLVLEQLGGWRGMVDATLPTVAFIVANSLGGLRTGVWAALGAALLVFLLRLARRESVQQAVSGLFAVGIAVAIAAASGQARDFFVLGILRNAALGGVLLASIAVRRPLVGVIAEWLAPSHLGAMASHSLPGLRSRIDRARATLHPGAEGIDPATGRRNPDPEPERHWRRRDCSGHRVVDPGAPADRRRDRRDPMGDLPAAPAPQRRPPGTASRRLNEDPSSPPQASGRCPEAAVRRGRLRSRARAPSSAAPRRRRG
jgi:hypothetical protein